MTKGMYIPIKTIDFTDGSVNKWYMVSWYKHNFIIGSERKDSPTIGRNFEFVSSLA
ncbi:hypothetical protein [Lactobacillus sp. ESL0230]|uniref:hypothetical protein n=1 Tax=Lactobacillus sp. ESL0230 TaxID=2069353 RepID=UPI0013145A42|nr:hypothetical protein [Lactobacillus sp. ESL0230]